jgi:ADP-heptose:LPS heptosyltransferase
MLPILRYNPYIRQVHSIEKEVTEVLAALKQEGFDYIIDLHKNIRSKRVIASLRNKTFSFSKLNLEKWILVNMKINLLPKKHLVDRYFEGVRALGITNDGDGLDHYISDDAELWGAEFAKSTDPYTCIILGANYYTKRIPTQLVQHIIHSNRYNGPYVLIGGTDVAKEGETLSKFDKVVNYCGQLNLEQSAALIKHSAHVVTGDTGMMHIAAAYKKPMTSIWGSTIPDFGMYPYFGDHAVLAEVLEVKGLSCRPCSKLGYNQCPKGHFNCMTDISL